MVRPPREPGGEAFSQAQSERGQPSRSHRVSLKALSKREIALLGMGGGASTEGECDLREGKAMSQEGGLHLGVL